MNAATQTRRRPVGGLRRLMGTQRGAVLVAAVVAGLAAVVLLTFAARYRDSVQSGTAKRTALVADRLIPKGTSGDIVVSDRFFRPSTVQESDLESGALTQAAAIDGKVATRDIYPGEQLTADAFKAGADPLRGALKGDQRAVSVSLDSAHGLVGEVRAGDHVDVLAGFNTSSSTTGKDRPQLRTLVENVLVLKAPSGDAKTRAGSTLSDLTVRVSTRDAAALAFASDNGKVWFVLRPPTGGSGAAPSAVTLDTILSGTPAIEVGGGR